jgi:hypothetical protein
MQKSPIDLWAEFKTYFVQSLEKYKNNELKKAWQSSGNRTQFYTKKFFVEIAAKMGLSLKLELFKVYAAFYTNNLIDKEVPLIFVESENDAASATHELTKLLSINAPCKILIVCCEWSNDMWKSGRQCELQNHWQEN